MTKKGLIGVQMSTIAPNKMPKFDAYESMAKLADIGYKCVEISQVPMNKENIAGFRRAIDELGFNVAAISANVAPNPMMPGFEALSNPDDFKKLGYAHGHACMLTLPHLVIDMMLRQEEGRKAPDLSLLAEIIGVEDGWGIARILLGLLAETDMQAETVVHGELMTALVDSVNVQRLGNHPVQLTKADLRSVYAGALQHLSVEAREAYAALWRSYDETHRRR